MALIKCSKCGNMVSDKASFCPKCGTPSLGMEYHVTENNPILQDCLTTNNTSENSCTLYNKKNKLILIACILVGAIFLCVGVYFLLTGNWVEDDVEVVNANANKNMVVVKSHSITHQGTNDVKLGMNIVNFLSNATMDGLAAKSKYDFYSRVEIKNIGISEYERGYFLYNDNQLVMILATTYDDEPNAKIRQIKIYSDAYFPTGFENVKVGVTLKKLVEDYNAKIHLTAGPEVAYLTIIIPGMEEGIIIAGDVKDVIDWGDLEENMEGFVDSDVALSNLKSGAVVNYILIGELF